jgi:hypothetical protein
MLINGSGFLIPPLGTKRTLEVPVVITSASGWKLGAYKLSGKTKQPPYFSLSFMSRLTIKIVI